uniref:F-box domain, leucine-rich repeat domain, L domain-like protein n=1 Tax=Tanacetum cinerariifolium TaxID=118510 RepID=A0A6L2KUU5_TANCI|nr:hypothetical protein [Tanacetum cinerariifolium]
MFLDDHMAHWANYLRELVRELPLHYPSWHQMSTERKTRVVAKIQALFDLRTPMEFDCWPKIYAGIQQHLQKIYNGKKAALKEMYWVPNPEDRTYDMESSATREYMSLIHTFFLTHTVGGEFLNPEDKALYGDMLRLQGLISNTPLGVPYTDDEIMVIVHEGKQWGHIPDPQYGGGSGSGGCGDDEPRDDEDGGEDEMD